MGQGRRNWKCWVECGLVQGTENEGLNRVKNGGFRRVTSGGVGYCEWMFNLQVGEMYSVR